MIVTNMLIANAHRTDSSLAHAYYRDLLEQDKMPQQCISAVDPSLPNNVRDCDDMLSLMANCYVYRDVCHFNIVPQEEMGLCEGKLFNITWLDDAIIHHYKTCHKCIGTYDLIFSHIVNICNTLSSFGIFNYSKLAECQWTRFKSTKPEKCTVFDVDEFDIVGSLCDVENLG